LPHRNNIWLNEKLRLLMRLRNLGVADTNVLGAIEKIPREIFVDATFGAQIYEDIALPIEAGQTISQPSIVAWMTQALELQPNMRVLEVGTGSGYQAAILSKLARRVYSIERHRNLLETAQERFNELGLTNIVTRIGDGSKGWIEAAPFERIIITASSPEIPENIIEQLATDGIMIVPVGAESAEQNLLKIVRTEASYNVQNLMKVRFVPLISGKIAN